MVGDQSRSATRQPQSLATSMTGDKSQKIIDIIYYSRIIKIMTFATCGTLRPQEIMLYTRDKAQERGMKPINTTELKIVFFAV